MLVTKKRLYNELDAVLSITDRLGDGLCNLEIRLDRLFHRLSREADYLFEDNKELLELCHSLEQRIEALESKKHHKSVKKTTKKKGK